MRHLIRIAAMLMACAAMLAGCATGASASQPAASPTRVMPETSSDARDAAATPSPRISTGQGMALAQDMADPATAPEHAASHDVRVALDPEAHKVAVDHTLTYRNLTGTTLEEMFLNVIPQAFQADGGGLEMREVLVDGAPATMEEVETTVWSLALPAPLEPDAQATIHMTYDVSVPDISNRFGYQEDMYLLGNFLATPAVWENGGWSSQPYVGIGDAFYTEIADYNVRVDVPEGYVVAATGEELADGTFQARSVRDFAFCASPRYKVLEAEENGTRIRVFYEDGTAVTAQRTLESARKSLRMCEEHFGEYPYPALSFTISELASGVGGMEYPMLVMMSSQYDLDDPDESLSEEERAHIEAAYDSSVCHETAHQWFYGIVGNNQVEEPWLDEGACRFAEYLYQAEGLNPVVESFDLEDRLAFRDLMVRGDDPDTAPDTCYLAGSLYHYAENDPMGYDEIYDKGAALLWRMRGQMGAAAFDEAMRAYVDEFAYDVVTTQEFQDFWNARDDFSELFDLYFHWDPDSAPPDDPGDWTEPAKPLISNDLVTFCEEGEGTLMTGYGLKGAQSVTIAECLKDFRLAEGVTAEVRAADGAPVADGELLATGQRITFWKDGASLMDATVVVQGDVLGTGRMSLAQVVRMCDAFTGTNPLTGAYLRAGHAEDEDQVTLAGLASQAAAYAQTLEQAQGAA